MEYIVKGKEIKFINIKELLDNKIYKLTHKEETFIGFYIRTNNLLCYYSLDIDYCNYRNIILGDELKFDSAEEIKKLIIEV